MLDESDDFTLFILGSELSLLLEQWSRAIHWEWVGKFSTSSALPEQIILFERESLGLVFFGLVF